MANPWKKIKKTKADPHDHNNHLPKDVLNLEQDPNSFKDPLEQQLEKQKTSLPALSDNSNKEPSDE